MQTFWEWVSQFRFAETYYGINAAQYDRLFDDELGKIVGRVRGSARRQALERMRGFRWMAYIATSVRNAGWRDQREVQERAHDVAAKLLTGGLLRDYDEARHGPMDLRFKRSVANAIRNLVEKERNRRRLLPTVPIERDDLSARQPAQDDEKVIQDFRKLVRRRLGQLGVAVLDVRLAGGEVKGLVGRPDLGSPGRWGIKNAVQRIKELAREYAQSLGDSELLRRIERAMASEEETIQRRRATTRARRQAVGA